MPRRFPHVLWFAFLAMAGCGGSGGGASGGTATIPATVALSGYVSADGQLYAPGGQPIAGDSYDPGSGVEQGVRGFFSFDISSIPTTATGVSAQLRVREVALLASSFIGLGRLLVDQAVYGAALDVGAYGRSFPLNEAFAEITLGVPPVDIELDATAVVVADLAAMRPRSQFRLRFEGVDNNNGVSDIVVFGQNGTPAGAVLVVRWN